MLNLTLFRRGKLLALLSSLFCAAAAGPLTAAAEEADPLPWSMAPFESTEVWYQDTGNPAGIPLVFVHGWSCDSTFWREQIPYFSTRYRVIAVDLPGFGRSGKPEDAPYDMAYFARAVKAVMDDATIERPVLIGHSSGYAVARQFLMDKPGLARAVVNVDGAYFVVPDHPEARAQWEESMQTMRDMFTGPNLEWAVEWFIGETFYGKTPEPLADEVHAVMATADPNAAVKSLVAMSAADQWKLRSFDVPCLAIYAAHPTLPSDHEDYLRLVFPSLTYEEWDDVGHYLMLQEPGRFNNAVQAFLDTLPD